MLMVEGKKGQVELLQSSYTRSGKQPKNLKLFANINIFVSKA